MGKKNGFLRWLEWAFHIETLSHLFSSEFVRTLLWPTVMGAATAVAGWTGSVPLMWIIVATLLAFMATVTGLLRASEYIERRDPQGKLVMVDTFLGLDLVPIPAPNRGQRRAGVQTAPPRHVDRIQLGALVHNRATFPLSVIVESAESEVAEVTPPRSRYPRAPVIIGPGVVYRISDERMSMNNLLCQNLDGRYKICLKYGLPGKERFELPIEHTVEIQMQPNGIYQVHTGVVAATQQA